MNINPSFTGQLSAELRAHALPYVLFSIIGIAAIVLSTQNLTLQDLKGLGHMGSNIMLGAGAGVIVLQILIACVKANKRANDHIQQLMVPLPIGNVGEAREKMTDKEYAFYREPKGGLFIFYGGKDRDNIGENFIKVTMWNLGKLIKGKTPADHNIIKFYSQDGQKN